MTSTHGHEEVEGENLSVSASAQDDLEVLASVALLEASPVVDTVGGGKVLKSELFACLCCDVSSVGSEWCRLDLGSR
jgi:hypothetical protein